jgi:hypothetical protein
MLIPVSSLKWRRHAWQFIGEFTLLITLRQICDALTWLPVPIGYPELYSPFHTYSL